jgi:hypothetical protein
MVPGSLGQRPAEHVRRHPRARPVPALALGREQRRTGPGVIGVELASHVLDEPAQVAVRPVDQRHQPRFRPRPPRALAVPDVELAEPAQLPPHVVQAQQAGLVDSRVAAAGSVIAADQDIRPLDESQQQAASSRPTRTSGR